MATNKKIYKLILQKKVVMANLKENVQIAIQHLLDAAKKLKQIENDIGEVTAENQEKTKQMVKEVEESIEKSQIYVKNIKSKAKKSLKKKNEELIKSHNELLNKVFDELVSRFPVKKRYRYNLGGGALSVSHYPFGRFPSDLLMIILDHNDKLPYVRITNKLKYAEFKEIALGLISKHIGQPKQIQDIDKR